jgi:3-deoxy-D-manno-octulosonic-acid transferase
MIAIKKELIFLYYNLRYSLNTFRLIAQIFLKHVVLSDNYYWKRYFWDRIGILPKTIRSLAEGNECVWLHAISEGDIISLSKFLSSIKEIAPNFKIIFSTNNHGSFKMLEQMDYVDGVIFYPWDVRYFCRKSLNAIKPRIYIIIQHDYSLTFLKEAKKNKVKTAIMSGFIRPGEMPEYDSFHYKRAFVGEFLNYLDYLGVQSKKDKMIFSNLGAEKEKIELTGSLKMDMSYARLNSELKLRIHKALGTDHDSPILLAGSTHEGEEEIICEAFKKVLYEVPKMKLLIVPRYIERYPEIEKIAIKKRLKTTIISKLNKASGKYNVFVINMFGILPKLYGIATIAFLGGSLIPRGGQNILEPLYHGIPVFFGPYMEHRKELSDKLKGIWTGIQVNNSEQLADGIIYLLNHQDKTKLLCKISKQLIKDNEQSLNRNVEFFKKILDSEGLISTESINYCRTASCQ